jgi:hypothetical protein
MMTSKHLVISCHNNDLEYLFKLTDSRKNFSKDNIFIYNKGEQDLKEYQDKAQIRRLENTGYSITSFCTHILENYNNLPDILILIKGNVVPRHVSHNYFERIFDNNYFTAIEEWEYHDQNQLSLQNGYAMISADGGWMEVNNSWYLNHPEHPTKYFRSYNEFVSFCFKNPVHPKYVRFAPGGCYIVPKFNILKYDKIFYKNIKTIVEHHTLSGETHLIERFMYTMWMCNYEVADTMKELIC